MSTFDEVLHSAQDLPPAERIRLIDALWDTVSPDDWQRPSGEWLAEAERRSAEYDEGRMAASPWPEVQERARRKAGLDG
jgi:putative addiction module component (TIGR02574 family)